MQIEITGKAAEIIQRLVTSGRYASAEEAVTALASAAAETLERHSQYLPTPPRPDESISPPCVLPLPPGKPVKVTRGVMPLPDPIDIDVK
jgi:hypothetical protein